MNDLDTAQTSSTHIYPGEAALIEPISVFLSWSGSRSQIVAKGMYEWLPDLFDGVSPWMSEQEIASGERSLSEIHQALSKTTFCIVIVTTENQGSAWINYEAGAASRALGSSAKVAPYLVDFVSPAELVGPLSQFQARLATRAETAALIQTLADAAGVSRDTARRRFDYFWPSLERIIEDSHSQTPRSGEYRSEREMLIEIVERLRSRNHRLPHIDSALPERMEGVAEELERPPTPIELRDREYVRRFTDLASELRQLSVAIESIA